MPNRKPNALPVTAASAPPPWTCRWLAAAAVTLWVLCLTSNVAILSDMFGAVAGGVTLGLLSPRKALVFAPVLWLAAVALRGMVPALLVFHATHGGYIPTASAVWAATRLSVKIGVALELVLWLAAAWLASGACASARRSRELRRESPAGPED